jgi:RND family efflux transporter MFP subunit
MRRGLKYALYLFAAAVLVVGGLTVWSRGSGPVEVQAVIVQLAGAGGAGGGTGITANGYVVAETKASVSSKIAGRLADLRVTEGSRVEKGDIMARLDASDYLAYVAQAEADVTRANASLNEAKVQRDQLLRDQKRSSDLASRNLLAVEQVESITAQLGGAEARVSVQEAQVKSAEAGLAAARANLENTFIRAPFTGTVLRKDAEVGEVVSPVSGGGGLTRGAVVTMADLATLQVEVDVNEAYIGQIKTGGPARIILDAYPDSGYRGRVKQIVPTANRQTATVLVKVSILDRDPRILPEMGARVEFESPAAPVAAASAPPRIFIPAAAVRNDGGESVVWIIRQEQLTRRVITAGPVSAGRREVRTGLTGGEQIVTAGPANLADGMRVTVVTP